MASLKNHLKSHSGCWAERDALQVQHDRVVEALGKKTVEIAALQEEFRREIGRGSVFLTKLEERTRELEAEQAQSALLRRKLVAIVGIINLILPEGKA